MRAQKRGGAIDHAIASIGIAHAHKYMVDVYASAVMRANKQDDIAMFQGEAG